MRALQKMLGALGWALLGVAVAVFCVHVMRARSLPDLEVWHRPPPLADFREENAGEGFGELLAREATLFDELERRVRAGGRGDPAATFSRYNPESPSNPANQPRNWNRSFELAPETPVGGALLLHGLSDSPYSVRALAELFRKRGWYALGLRLPGHGTIPGALADTHWRDWREAVRLGARRAASRAGAGRPLVVAGYSNGSALAVDYALGVAEGSGDPPPALLVMLSPAMGVSPMAALSRLMLRLARLPGLEKLAWQGIQPEYDPFKYNSFPVRAGEQIYQLTSQSSRRLVRLVEEKGASAFPRVLVFQSIVDATVPPAAVVDRLLSRIGGNGSELVLFDVNRLAPVEPFMRTDHDALLHSLTGPGRQPFSFTLVTNASPETRAMVARRRPAGESGWREKALGLAWPQNVYSLSHVALPFPPDDPLYGPRGVSQTPQPINLGSLDARGERGVFGLPMDQLMRLRFNPFFPYIEARVAAELEQLTAALQNSLHQRDHRL
jgi:alpha-beta hydrolase superfamily lysophospholipase